LVYNTSSCCPVGWSTSSASLASSSLFPYYKKCLRFFTTALSFTAAQTACGSYGGNLVTIASYDENLFVMNLTGGRASWVGLNDIVQENVWTWMDSSVPCNVALWNPGLVGNTAARDCVQISITSWTAMTCSTPTPFVCSMNIPNMDVLSGITDNTGCGQLVTNQMLSSDPDVVGTYSLGQGYPGQVPMPNTQTAAGGKGWTFSPNEGGVGGILTLSAQGTGAPSKLTVTAQVVTCPIQGCWLPPPPPPAPPPEKNFLLWSAAETWAGLLSHPGNPMNVLKQVVDSKGAVGYQVIASQTWTSSVPGACDNVWIPSWKKVIESLRIERVLCYTCLACLDAEC
jgi:hypothetical protein